MDFNQPSQLPDPFTLSEGLGFSISAFAMKL